MRQYSVAFYTEAGTKRGMGHLVRCYTICERFKKEGFHTSFFLDSDINFDYKFNDINYFKWDKLSLKSNYDVIFIDSYEADINIYNNISKLTKVAVFIDDYGRLKYPKGIILNFAPDAKELFFQEKSIHNNYLLGLDYIPIREEFLQSDCTKKEQIFIMLGGSDTAGLSLQIIEELKYIDIKKVIVVNDKNSVKEIKMYKNIIVLYKPTDKKLIRYMGNSSIAISTASMTIYELSYFNIPTLIIATSTNQEIGSSQLIRHNLADDFINIVNNDWGEKIMKSISLLIFKRKQHKNKKVDGVGTKRIIQYIKESLKT